MADTNIYHGTADDIQSANHKGAEPQELIL
jgi:hypothetical protein